MGFACHQDDFHFEHLERVKPPHPPTQTHETYELFYFLEGDADLLLGTRRHTLQPYSLAIIKPDEPHRLLPASEKPMSWYLIRFPGNLPPEHLRAMLQSLGSLYIIPGTRIAEEFARMDVYAEEILEDQLINVMIHQLAIILNYACNFVGMRTPEDPIANDAAHLIAYINRHLTAIHTVSDICRNVHLSASSLQKLVNPQLHQPVMAYVRQQKCALANKLLLRGHSPTQTYLQCGFRNYSTFYRTYRKLYGVAPEQTIKTAEQDKHRT